MLQKLVIKNYAIIDSLILEPDSQLNTVTGETGAGKSIILGALSLILGERADTSVLIDKNEKSVVEGYFDVRNNAKFRQALKENDIDEDDVCIIRREIAISGKSRAFVNDTPVTLNVLNALTSLLVDLHRQFDHLALEEDDFSINTLDAISNTFEKTTAFRQIFQQHRKLKKELKDAQSAQANMQKDADYKQYLFDELNEASLKPNEIEDAATELKQMSHAEKIMQVIGFAVQTLEDGDNPFLPELKRINQQMGGIVEVMPSLQPLKSRLESVWEELKDISSELQSEQDKVAHDPERMDLLQQRIDIGYKLLKKHALTETAELLALQSNLEQELKSTLNVLGTIDKLIAEEAALNKTMLSEGAKLSEARKKAIPAFVQKMNELLALVGMPNARFDVRLEPCDPHAGGIEKILFLLDANKSGQFQLVQKAASGGEMSRIMLCLKSLTAKALHMPTLIFDEVDTGISGEAARQVGILLRGLSQYHQVLCITHQPQVAAKGTYHFYVYKQEDKTGRLSTNIKMLAKDERVLSIARMIGGETPSEAAMSNARELVTAN